MSNVFADRLRTFSKAMPEAEGIRRAMVHTINSAADEIDRLQTIVQELITINKENGLITKAGYDCKHCGEQIVFGDSVCSVTGEQHAEPEERVQPVMGSVCPDCNLNVIFAYSQCEVTGKSHANKPHVVQHAPVEGPIYTIADLDLDRLLNETHWESVAASQGIGTVEGSIAWMEALEKVEARLAQSNVNLLELLSALPDLVIDFNGYVPGDHALRLAKRAGILVPEEAWKAVNQRAEADEAKVVRSVREIEEGSFIYPVKVIVAYTLAGTYANVALNKDELLRYVASGLDASPVAEVSLIEEYRNL